MAWHDTWTAMKQKPEAKPQPQGKARKRAAVPKRATAKSTAAKGRRPPSLG